MQTKTKNLILTSFIIISLFAFSQTASATTVTKTLYAWARDLAGNVSAYLSDSVDITISGGTTYYVSNTDGNDSNNGTSPSTPWKTISKVNTTSLSPGDSVLFKRGDTFYGTIIPHNSGTSGNPITYSSYGSGEKPIITGFTTLSNWTDEGNGIYSSSITSEAQTNMVTVNGTQVAMGRYPNAGTNLTYESHSGTTSITDNQMTGSPNWTGAELVINKEDWVLDRTLITNHNGTTLTYTNLGSTDEPQNNRYYFIQNDLRTLDAINEWYHNTSTGKFYIYGNPSGKTVKVATLNYLFNFNTQSYITVDGLHFIGSINSSVYIPYGGSHRYFKNSMVDYSGRKGVYFDGTSYDTFNNNIISNCNEAGFFGYSNNNNITITNNIINNIGLIIGQALFGTQSVGVYTYGLANALIQYNSISNIAYNGIYFIGSNVQIKNNFINYPMQLLDDGGGIYTNGSLIGRVIDGNIILNSGVGGYDNNLCAGIYNDSGGDNLIVTNNTITNSTAEGIKNNLGSNNTYSGNTLYNNKYGLYITEWYTDYGAVTGISLQNNIVIAKNNDQNTLYMYFDYNNLQNFGTANNNYYARPIDDNASIYTYQPSTGYVNRTLASWQSFSGQDANSHTSPVSISNVSNLRFEYNETNSNKIVSLGSDSYMDVTGTTYTGNITLTPYTSIVLIKTN